MATVSTNTIINAALRKIGVFDSSETASGTDYESAELAFDLLIKDLVVRGADLFTRETITLFVQKGQKSYALGGADHSTESYVETTLSAAEASSQTVISVTSSTGMTAADYVGIKMDDGSTHWSTISSVDSGIQITINDATDDDAASGNKVYSYTTKSDIPKKILFALRRDSNNIDTPIRMIGETEYLELSDKGSSGPPVSAWYLPSASSGTLYVWPVDGDKIVLSAQVMPSVIPIEWGNPLIWGLAAELGPEYAVSDKEMKLIYAIATAKIDAVLDYDVENADVVFAMR